MWYLFIDTTFYFFHRRKEKGKMVKEEKRSRKAIALLLVLTTILAMASILPVSVAAGSTVVSISNASADTGKTVKVPINITNVTDLGAATIELSYDKDVVTVESVSNGNLGDIIPGINNTAGMTKMSWFSVTGKVGDFVFAYVTLKAVGSPGKTSALDLKVKKLVDAKNVPITHTVDDGVFTVAEKKPDLVITAIKPNCDYVFGNDY